MKQSIQSLKNKTGHVIYARGIVFILLISIAAFTSCGSSNDSSVGGDTTSAVYGIWGTVSGTVNKGVTITLSGTGTSTTATTFIVPEGLNRQNISAKSGFYSFVGLANGSYTVTPSLAGYIFTPVSVTVTINDTAVPDVDFTSTTVTTSTYGPKKVI
jgi:hypothetical protein